MRRASFVQRLATNPFKQALHQVDRVVAALAAIFTSRIWPEKAAEAELSRM
jgi:hypothetical protein